MERLKGHKGVVENLTAGSAGAIDELLFGLPEYAIKNLGGREGVEKYIKEHEKAYRTGEGVGTVASMLLPVPGAAALKGAGLLGKGVKAADTALDAAKAAKALSIGEKAAKIGGMGLKGAAAGGLEAGVRGVTSEKKAGDILRDIAAGTTFGGLGGVAGGALAEAIPSIARETAKATGKQYLAGRDMTTRDLRTAYMKSLPKGAGASYKAQNVDDYVRDVIDYAKKEIPRGEGMAEALSKKTTEMYKTLDKGWDASFKGVNAKDIFANAISGDDVAALAESYGDDTAKQAYKYVMAQTEGKKGLYGIKKHLQNVIETARTSPSISENVELSQAIQDLAGGLRGKMDDLAIASAQKNLGKTIDGAKLRKDYAMLKPFENLETREGTTISKLGGGSPTTEKKAILDMLQGNAPTAAAGSLAGTAGALMTGQDDDAQTRLRNIALASLGGVALMKGAGAAGSRLAGGLDTLAVKAAGKIPEVMPQIGKDVGALIGGQAAGNIARKTIEEVAPSTPEQAEAVETASASGTPAYKDRILEKMQAYALENGVDPASEEFQQFAGEVYAATDGFAPEKVGVILYADPAEQAAYMKALEISRSLRDVMPKATAEGGGMFQGTSDEEKIQRDAATAQLAALVGDAAKSTGAEVQAKKSINKILSSGKSPEEKASLVKATLLAYGVDVDELEQMGVV